MLIHIFMLKQLLMIMEEVELDMLIINYSIMMSQEIIG